MSEDAVPALARWLLGLGIAATLAPTWRTACSALVRRLIPARGAAISPA
jgi:hypothetical protein